MTVARLADTRPNLPGFHRRAVLSSVASAFVDHTGDFSGRHPAVTTVRQDGGDFFVQGDVHFASYSDYMSEGHERLRPKPLVSNTLFEILFDGPNYGSACYDGLDLIKLSFRDSGPNFEGDQVV